MRVIDLSLPIRNYSMEAQADTSFPQALIYVSHEELTRVRAKKYKLDPARFPYPNSMDATTIVSATAHAGTHLDAPYHFGPEVEGKPSKRIDEVPLEWCFHDGVVLDFTHKQFGELITAADMEQAVKKIDYQIKPFDIVLIHTGSDRYWNDVDFVLKQPGMSRESTLWAIERGVKIMGIDAWGFDVANAIQIERYKKGEAKSFWEAHYTGREREYCHIEKLTNLDKLPPFGFKVAAFPIKLEHADAGWVRAVAILDD